MISTLTLRRCKNIYIYFYIINNKICNCLYHLNISKKCIHIFPSYHNSYHTFYHNVREGFQIKKSNCKLFPKGGGGSTQKFTFQKSVYTVKRGFKLDFFNTRMCFGKFWREGGVNANLEKVYILNFNFFGTLPLGTFPRTIDFKYLLLLGP